MNERLHSKVDRVANRARHDVSPTTLRKRKEQSDRDRARFMDGVPKAKWGGHGGPRGGGSGSSQKKQQWQRDSHGDRDRDRR